MGFWEALGHLLERVPETWRAKTAESLSRLEALEHLDGWEQSLRAGLSPEASPDETSSKATLIPKLLQVQATLSHREAISTSYIPVVRVTSDKNQGVPLVVPAPPVPPLKMPRVEPSFPPEQALEPLELGPERRIFGLASVPTKPPKPLFEPWILEPDESWQPQIPQRETRVTLRSGYGWVWKLEESTRMIRRPYLLRLDLARVGPLEEPRPEQRLRPMQRIVLSSDAFGPAPRPQVVAERNTEPLEAAQPSPVITEAEAGTSSVQS